MDDVEQRPDEIGDEHGLDAPQVELAGSKRSVDIEIVEQAECGNEEEDRHAEACDDFKEGNESYTAEQYCGRIAGILASLPLTESATFKPLPELTGCTKLTHANMDTAIDNGELIVFWDGEKVKIARGVNSFKTTTEEQGEQFKKIHIVAIMDAIQSDIRKIAGDTYIGRFPNTYANKCLLLAAVGNYLNSLAAQSVLTSATIDIDEAANKKYLISKGIDVTAMSDTEIREAPTGDKVFLTATMKLYDVIEDIVLPITV